MQYEFSQPQRQSQVGILVMFFHTLQQYVRALLPVLFIWIFKFDEINKLWLTVGTLAVFILIAVVAYLQYLNFTFHLDSDNSEFIIQEGIVNKTRTVIQLDKIQQVNLTQSVIQRIIGVYGIDVDTPGSNKKEGRIRAVSHTLAVALKARLLDNQKQSETKSDPATEEVTQTTTEEKPFISISFLSLLKIGITTNYIKSLGLIVAFIATIYENVSNYAEYSAYDGTEIERYFDQQLALNSILMIVGLLFGAVLVINVIRVIVRYFNYTITRQRGSLLLSFGLLNTKSTIVKPEKVQVTSVSQNYFQKKMDILELQIKQATSGEKEERKSAIEIPGCNSRERDAIMKLLFGSIPEKGVMLKPNFRRLAFSVFLLIVVPLSVFYILAYYAEPRFFDFSVFAMVYAVFAAVVLYFSFRNYRLFISDGFIIKQSGAWDVTNEIIEPGKIQAITTSQLFWHKGLDIGSITIHTAGGNLHFDLGNFSMIKDYVNLWLYELETTDSNWM